MRRELQAHLHSFKTLAEGLNDLSLEDLLEMIEHEAMTQRRRTLIERMIKRAVALREQQFRQNLRRKYL